jgi:hypothetical protein
LGAGNATILGRERGGPDFVFLQIVDRNQVVIAAAVAGGGRHVGGFRAQIEIRALCDADVGADPIDKEVVGIRALSVRRPAAKEGLVVYSSGYVDAPALKEPDELEAARYFGDCCRTASRPGKRRKR